MNRRSSQRKCQGREDSRHRRLRLVRNRLLGNVPKGRDDFAPETLLNKIKGGEKILVLDSNKDLPNNWRERCRGSSTDQEVKEEKETLDDPNLGDNKFTNL